MHGESGIRSRTKIYINAAQAAYNKAAQAASTHGYMSCCAIDSLDYTAFPSRRSFGVALANERQTTTNFSNMNAFFLAVLALFTVASSVQGKKVPLSSSGQWSSDISMQMKKSGAQVAPACSEAALSVLKNEVGEWLRDELIDLFGEAAFTLGQVTGVEDKDTISFTASVECLDCIKVPDKKSIAYIVMFFMQHMVDEWIEENKAGVLDGCMGEDTTVLNVSIGGKKAAALM
jgi:hypothetical protein